MPSLTRTTGYGHRITYIGPGQYRLSWTFDRKVGRLRHPTGVHRDTDRTGAERFSKKWNVAMPVDPVVAR